MDYLPIPRLTIFLVAAIALTVIGCTRARVLIEGEYGTQVQVQRESDNRHIGKRIPPGHMPPPGKCRIWYPNTPPGQQPPPGDCHRLSNHVPRGAWLIEG